MKRRTFLKTSALTAAAALLPGRVDAADSHFLLSAEGCGRATGYAEANKIITLNSKTHVAWIDSPEEGFRVRVRTLDRSSNRWSPVYTVGEGFDNHGGPALTVDSQGYLHIAYYPHHHPMRYRRSVRPNDASEWGEEMLVGDRTTYPTLVCGKDDTLYLTVRESAQAAPWVVNMYAKTPGGDWGAPRKLLTALHTGYAHFMEALAWGPDHQTLHLATRIYGGSTPRGHTIGYMRSEDNGMTWTRYDGSPLRLPVSANTVDIVESSPEGAGVGLRAGCIAVSPDNVPIILCSTYDPRPLEAWLAAPDSAGGWKRTPLRPFLPEAFREWGLATPGGLTYAHDGRLFVVLTMFDVRDPGDALWGHPSSEIVLLVSDDGGASFSAEAITEPDAGLPRWLPSIERPTGHNRIDGVPGIIYTEGERGDRNTDLLSNNVYWAGVR